MFENVVIFGVMVVFEAVLDHIEAWAVVLVAFVLGIFNNLSQLVTIFKPAIFVLQAIQETQELLLLQTAIWIGGVSVKDLESSIGAKING